MSTTKNLKPWKTTQTYSDGNITLPFKLASFHDVHLGHRRTPTKDILKGFKDILRDEAEVSSWDMIVFPGDLFDRLLFLKDENIGSIFSAFSILLRLAKKYDIVIRILKGTPGHDYDQSELIIHLANTLNLGVDIKYVKELSIEYIEKFNLNMLYVPDEWRNDVHDTYDEVLELMNTKSLEQVDFCLFHGAFNYQINENLNPKSHNEELWSSIVKYYILAGHVHYRSQYKNILVAGSFDRLSHGEEEPKGWITCDIKEDHHEILFHENLHATIYKTLDVRGKSLEDVITLLNEVCISYPKYSYIRLHVTSKDEISDGLKEIKKLFGYYYFSLKLDKEESKEKERSLKLVADRFEPIELNKDNIVRIIDERLKDTPVLDTTAVLDTLNKYI